MQVAYCVNKLWCHWQQQHLQKAELSGPFLHVVPLADLVLLVSSRPGVRWRCGCAVPERHTLSEVPTSQVSKMKPKPQRVSRTFFFFNLKKSINFLEDKPAGFLPYTQKYPSLRSCCHLLFNCFVPKSLARCYPSDGGRTLILLWFACCLAMKSFLVLCMRRFMRFVFWSFVSKGKLVAIMWLKSLRNWAASSFREWKFDQERE